MVTTMINAKKIQFGQKEEVDLRMCPGNITCEEYLILITSGLKLPESIQERTDNHEAGCNKHKILPIDKWIFQGSFKANLAEKAQKLIEKITECIDNPHKCEGFKSGGVVDDNLHGTTIERCFQLKGCRELVIAYNDPHNHNPEYDELFTNVSSCPFCGYKP